MTIRAALIIIGNEILSGRTQDVNLAYLATKLNEIGVRLAESRVVPDIEEEIVEAVNHLRAKYDYVFTTGGIGPTHDDITAACVAKAFDLPLTQHPEALKILTAHYAALDVELNESRLRMTMTPEGAGLIDNPVSAAPGFKVENVHVMAGVPKIMQAMLDGILPTLQGGEVMKSRTILCSRPEGEIAEGLGKIQNEYPELDLGSYPAYASNGFRLSLVLRGTDQTMIDLATAEVTVLIESLNGKSEIVKS
ncbi:competence/damage-inducible protein A [Curvivirga aplysinae]|uniref:competence/damage-inducible protein A n=1 Tax=Curvivirga aplysinae TaxID=2529852 RepID=UPI0012BC18F9|nr:molybdopterin-binding protein [Curvivirga aplysinae]MTI08432.1 competence/damage-inducible protein A [Curvivirga aplysinae]